LVFFLSFCLFIFVLFFCFLAQSETLRRH
jgi:hypothetical protein